VRAVGVKYLEQVYGIIFEHPPVCIGSDDRVRGSFEELYVPYSIFFDVPHELLVAIML
jgi:hypothetical protein